MKIKSLLVFPLLYESFIGLIGGFRARSIYAKDYIRARSGFRVLDIGCGPGQILEYMPPVDYIGFDMNQKYINSAIQKFKGRGLFICRKVGEMSVDKPGSFDLALATGVLHHLSDDEALELFKTAKQALKSGGRLVTLDGFFVPGQSKIARYVISNDRGQFIRTKDEYLKLASNVFCEIKADIRHDLLRVPYTHIILECTK